MWFLFGFFTGAISGAAALAIYSITLPASRPEPYD